MTRQALDILPPILGVDRQLAYQSQRPYTCADAMNYWPRDRFRGRMRGGDRPGLERTFPLPEAMATSSTAAPIHLLANVRAHKSTLWPFKTKLADDFNTIPGDEWSTFASWSENSWSWDEYYQCLEHCVTTTSDRFAALLLRDQNVDITEGYVAEITILNDRYLAPSHNWTEEDPSGVYHLFFGLDNDNPQFYDDGVVDVYINTRTGNTLNVSWCNVLHNYTHLGSAVNTNITDLSRKLRVWWSPGDLIRARWGNAYVEVTPGSSPPGQRIAIGVYGTGEDIRRCYRIDQFQTTFYKPGYAGISNRNVVVVAGGTNAVSSKLDIRYEKEIGEFTAVDDVQASVVNDDARQLQAAELLGRLYIVGEKDPQVWCFCPWSDGAIGTIAEVHAIAGDAFAFSPEPSEDTPPTGCTWTCAWNNRLVCGGNWDDPQNAFMSKFNEPQNWDYGSHVGSAMRLNTTGIDTGKLGEPIVTGIPTSDDYLILGCLNSLYVLRGDPTLGGQKDRLSASIGIVAAQAWARGPNGETVILSQDGLYGIPAGITGYPESVSRERLPQELRGIDVVNNRVLMAYDVHNRGVFIGVTPMFGSGGKYFWLDWEARGFWPMEFNPSFEPTSLVYRNADAPSDQRLLLGCRDGHVRAFNDNAFTDDGVNYKSKLLIGPIALGGGGYNDGMLLEVVGQLGAESGNITCGVKVGKSVEGAYNADERSKFTLRAGKNLTHRPRLRGNAAFIRLSSDGGVGWAMENMTLVREKLGKQRLL